MSFHGKFFSSSGTIFMMPICKKTIMKGIKITVPPYVSEGRKAEKVCEELDETLEIK